MKKHGYSIVMLLVCILCCCTLHGQDTIALDRFYPYAFIQDSKPPFYTKFKAEGASVFSITKNSLNYTLKQLHKKRDFNSAEIKYFYNQNALFNHLETYPNNYLSSTYVKLGLVGDIMWIRNNWNDFIDPVLLSKMQTFDFMIGNLESPVAGHKKVRSFLPAYLKFNAEPGLISSFKDPEGKSLFKALSFANNHTMDQGVDGAMATLHVLDRLGILQSGVSEARLDTVYQLFEENGIKFGFYAACWGLNNSLKPLKTDLKINIIPGLAPIGSGIPELSEVYHALTQMENDSVDFRIISLHWGAEYEMLPHPVQVIMARKIVEAGADLILGHHPHVVQPFEIIFVNGFEDHFREDSIMSDFIHQNLITRVFESTGRPRKALVLYSLGNFVSRMWTKECRESLILGLNIHRKENHSVDWEISDRVYVKNSVERNGFKTGHRLSLIK